MNLDDAISFLNNIGLEAIKVGNASSFGLVGAEKIILLAPHLHIVSYEGNELFRIMPIGGKWVAYISIAQLSYLYIRISESLENAVSSVYHYCHWRKILSIDEIVLPALQLQKSGFLLEFISEDSLKIQAIPNLLSQQSLHDLIISGGIELEEIGHVIVSAIDEENIISVIRPTSEITYKTFQEATLAILKS